MSRSQILKQFFFKSVMPITTALLLFFIFKSACTQDGQVDYLRLWILCGLPFGVHRMFFWIIPGGSMASFVSQGLATIVLGGMVGGFVLFQKLSLAIIYIPMTVVRLIDVLLAEHTLSFRFDYDILKQKRKKR